MSHTPAIFLPTIDSAPPCLHFRSSSARLAIDEEETQAQNKVLFGMFLLMLIYPTAFVVMWAFLWFTPVGAILSATLLWLFASYHNKLINGEQSQLQCAVLANMGLLDNYER